MTLETPEQHELRTMPEVYGTARRASQWVYGTDQRKWHAEENRKHSRFMEDPEYRRQCIEREEQLNEMKKGNYLI